MSGALFAVLPVGDSRRAAIGRVAFGTLWVAGLFFLFSVPTKQFKPLYGHAPWLDDPFDAIYSFAMFFVPLVGLCLLVEVSLCLKSEALPLARVHRMVRACRVVLVMVGVTLVSCWISVAVGANSSAWRPAQTGGLIAFLILVTIGTGRVTADLGRLRGHAALAAAAGDRSGDLVGVPIGDWLGDLVEVVRRESRWCGPLRPWIVAAATWAERTIVARLRRHPLLGAALAAIGFGLGVGLNQAIREGYNLPATVLTVGLLIAGMYAFLVVAGAHLGIVRSERPLTNAHRRAVEAQVGACAAAVLALTFRNSLWWIVASNATAAGAAQFADLLAIAATSGATATLATQSLRAAPDRPQE